MQVLKFFMRAPVMIIIAVALTFSACEISMGEVVTISTIDGVTPPAYGETPVTAITETDLYTGSITWTPADATFAGNTVYTATITLTAKSGYTFDGVGENFFTVAGADSVKNDANSGVVIATFPKTGDTPPAVVDIKDILGVTAPVLGATPVTAITETAQCTGSITWTPVDATFAGNTVYTAIITLTAKSGYTFDGVGRNFFTVAGADSVKNDANSGVVIATFPATGDILPAVVDIKDILGVTAPVLGATPVTAITETAQCTGSITWTPVDATFAGNTVYTATITLTAKSGYTFDGVGRNFFTVTGADSVSNDADSGVVTAVFPETVSFDNAYVAGQKETFTADSVPFKMAYVPGGLSFKTREDDRTTDSASLNTITKAYRIGETEVTYELWYAVYNWAKDNGYTFGNAGREGSDGIDGAPPTAAKQEPVTYVNWRDSIVWCNALTEWYNENNGSEPDLDLVYYTDSDYTRPLRTSTDTSTISTVAGSQDKPFIKASVAGNTDIFACIAKGFRLPTIAEWSAAARYKGSDSSNGAYEYPVGSGMWWTPGDYASGATADCNNNEDVTEAVAVYNSTSTKEVKSRGEDSANALGLFDMSGNVYEWNFDWRPSYSESVRLFRGGGWFVSANYLQVGYWYYFNPYYENNYLGFRFARTQSPAVAISGITAPVTGETPVTEITETDKYRGSVSWSPSDSPFKGGVTYTATITLTAKSGYTFNGVGENSFTVAGADSVSNDADSGVVTAVFPKTVSFDNAYVAGQKETFTADSVTFNMAYVPGGLSFKTRMTDFTTDFALSNAITKAYWIGETEVTYELWYAVYNWAKDNGYTFGNAGREGRDCASGAPPTVAKQEPVTTINWRDSIVWCNALTEWYNANNGSESDLDLVYYTDSDYTRPLRTSTNTSIIKTVAGSQDKPFIKASVAGNTDIFACIAKGFRLPTIAEWSAAARYKGSDSSNGAYEYPVGSGMWWTPGTYASGATADCNNNEDATEAVAVYRSNSGFSIKEVKSLGEYSANALGLFDMSGNVWEWNFDLHPSYKGSFRVIRGGSWNNSAYYTQVGHWNGNDPYRGSHSVGFRFVRTK